MSEKLLIAHCAPTLANLKTASLFSFVCDEEECLRAHLDAWNAELNPKGVYAISLRLWDGRALIYVYRKRQLSQLLQRPGVVQFLRRYGYADPDADVCLCRLRERMNAQAEFPHEIGVFLDYPLDDVIGFIENGGRNYKCAGCWKVYGDADAARARFDQLARCRAIYARMFQSGMTIMQLTVAV
ncbi:MAG: DUF3793 family protein [Clostridia bacterium]|nr:DUF3793 family protein [Clostridia bacterium]